MPPSLAHRRDGASRLRRWLSVVAVAALAAAGCRQDMHDQAKYEPLEASPLFAGGSSSRKMVQGTVARGDLREDRRFYTGLEGEDQMVSELPVTLDRDLLERGRNRYDVFCSPCHGRRGDGYGMIVRRGFKRPESFHSPRLRDSPAGYYYGVVTNGFGQMSSYAAQIAPRDRWAITAYIRALQLARNVPVERLSEQERGELVSATPAPPEDGMEDHGE